MKIKINKNKNKLLINKKLTKKILLLHMEMLILQNNLTPSMPYHSIKIGNKITIQ